MNSSKILQFQAEMLKVDTPKIEMRTIHFVGLGLMLTIGLLVTVSSRPFRRFRQRQEEPPALTILIGTKRCEKKKKAFEFEFPFEFEFSTMGMMGSMVMVCPSSL